VDEYATSFLGEQMARIAARLRDEPALHDGSGMVAAALACLMGHARAVAAERRGEGFAYPNPEQQRTAEFFTYRRGLIKKSIVTIRKFEIEVQNYKKTAQNVTVYDQIPVSQNEQIAISGVQFSEKPKSIEKETGKVAWEIPLKPGEKKKLTLEFSVERPEGVQVAGI
jgi:hypothetical protein